MRQFATREQNNEEISHPETRRIHQVRDPLFIPLFASLPNFIRSRYNKLSREIRDVANKLTEIDPSDPFRTEMSSQLLEKLYVMGLIPTKWDLNNVDNITASSFCRRRLPVVMKRSHMSESIPNASKLVEHGHVRVGPQVIKDPAFLVNRTLEDFVTWVDGSAIQKHVLEYNDIRDDFEL